MNQSEAAYRQWLSEERLDPALREELLALAGDEKEIEEYRRIRESGERIQSITILSDEEMAAEAASHTADTAESTEPILETPPHDTGNVGYSIGSFFLPIIGIIAAEVYKHKQYYHNYKACKKGAVIGFIVLGVILLIFLLALLLVVIR